MPKKDDGSGEWLIPNAKTWLKHWNGIILEQSQNALSNHQASVGREALLKALHAIKSVDEFEWELDFQAGKVGLTAEAILLDMCAQIWSELQQADELYESTLLFEFAPHGTEFLIAAELVIPLDEICISDEFAWYSGDGGDTIEINANDYLRWKP